MTVGMGAPDDRGILDGSDSSDSLDSTDSTDSSNYSDAGNVDEDIATSDETAPVEEQKVWVQRCLEELFPIGSGGLKPDTETRWNSTYIVLATHLRMRKTLDEVFNKVVQQFGSDLNWEDLIMEDMPRDWILPCLRQYQREATPTLGHPKLLYMMDRKEDLPLTD
ncbi:hypothetical protein V1504DRAFT_436480 [Lipomyces starkeyi]